MTSLRKIESNRRNALKSTGPRTAEGKAIVARNAMTHGLRAQHVLIDGESEEEFEQFREAMIAGLEGAEVLNKFIRYEAHIDRTLSGSVRDLERV